MIELVKGKGNVELDVPAITVSGSSNYEELTNKPKINNVELSGNKTLDELGVQPKGDYALKSEIPVIEESKWELIENVTTNSTATFSRNGYNLKAIGIEVTLPTPAPKALNTIFAVYQKDGVKAGIIEVKFDPNTQKACGRMIPFFGEWQSQSLYSAPLSRDSSGVAERFEDTKITSNIGRIASYPAFPAKTKIVIKGVKA